MRVCHGAPVKVRGQLHAIHLCFETESDLVFLAVVLHTPGHMTHRLLLSPPPVSTSYLYLLSLPRVSTPCLHLLSHLTLKSSGITGVCNCIGVFRWVSGIQTHQICMAGAFTY